MNLLDATCPRCGATLDGEGDVSCPACGREATLLRFPPAAPLALAAEQGGRCAVHATVPAVADCSRCGSFLCDVCITRTGDDVLCPGCFTLLHERGELSTTRSRRLRWDHLTVLVATVGLLVCLVGGAAALVTGAVALARRRKEPWISIDVTVLGMLLGAVPLLFLLVRVLAR